MARRSRSHRPITIIVFAILAALIVIAVVWFWVWARDKQSPPLTETQPSQTLTITRMLPITPSIYLRVSPGLHTTQSNPTREIDIKQAKWLVYESAFGYHFSYPKTWNINRDHNAPSSSVWAPGAKYPDGSFTVEREAGGPAWCENRIKWLSEDNPNMKQKQIFISGYHATKLDGKSTIDGYDYDRKAILIDHEKTCYYVNIITRNNPEERDILDRIMTTFRLID